MKTTTLKEKISPEERETHLWFDPIDQLWHMYSNISRHFNKALRAGWTPTCKFVYENGTVAAMRLSASERGITIKTPKKRELSDEHKAKLLNFQNDNLECDFED